MKYSNGIDVLLFQASSYAAGECPGENDSDQKQDSDARKDVLIDVAEAESDVGAILGSSAKQAGDVGPVVVGEVEEEPDHCQANAQDPSAENDVHRQVEPRTLP